ncbi:MAG: YkgJ family cysteine cluster protein [Dehalococcoidales bacterium]|nr:YkgJ family cysteine cluster protein [Dehalococcoidales bacterium]
MDSFQLNQEIAYLGLVGNLRKEYCIRFIRKKQQFFKELTGQQEETLTANSETLSCYKGCSRCCSLFIGASVQEAEAIVYYLYQNEDKLQRFLETYPVWREKVRASGDLFRKPTAGDKSIGDLAAYARLKIPCPFLQDDACSIYEVRPFVCAGLIVTTPPEWCDPKHPKHSKRKRYIISDSALADRTFYWKNLEKPVWSFMPIMVYDILEQGMRGIPGISRMGDLLSRYIYDPDVQDVIRRYEKPSV